MTWIVIAAAAWALLIVAIVILWTAVARRRREIDRMWRDLETWEEALREAGRLRQQRE